MNYKEFPIAMGTASGTFLSTIAALKAEDIFVTAILAAQLLVLFCPAY